MSDIPSEISHDQHAVRRQKLADLRAAGVDPFRASFTPTHFSQEAIRAYVDGQDYAAAVAVAGRLVVIRDMGKSQFAKILDQQGQIQLFVRKDALGDEAYAAFKKLDLGDLIGVAGTLFKTKAGEITVKADRLHAGRQGAPAAAGKMARADGSRAGLPAALPGPDRQSRVPPAPAPALADRRGDPALPGRAPVHRGGDARPANGRRRRRRAAVRHPPPGPRGGLLPAHLAGALSQAPAGRRLRPRVRDRPQLPQRGDLPPAQSRVHDARGLPGLQRPPGHDGADQGAADDALPGRPRPDSRSSTRPAARTSTLAASGARRPTRT